MFENLFRGKKGISTSSPEQLNAKERMRAIEGSSAAELAAKLLIAPTALLQLTRQEAFTVVSYMTPPIAHAGLYRGLLDLKSSIERWRGLAPDAESERPIVGEDRFFWASDFPHPDHAPEYVGHMSRMAAQLSPPARRGILGANVLRAYGIAADDS